MVNKPIQTAEIISLFPTSILVIKYKENLKKELKFIKNLAWDPEQLTGVFRSTDTYIMKRPELTKLKKFFQVGLATYCDEVLGTKSKLDITQAWIQRNLKTTFTHQHIHPNSIISGVFYFKNNNHTGISFGKDNVARLTLLKYKTTRLNSESFTLYPKTGDLVLFPSHLTHSVPINRKEEDRYCLAFNTFCFGELGSMVDSTHLIINKV